MSKVVDIRKADDPRGVIHRAVHLLAEGELAAFPTETVYVVAAHGLHTKAVQKLQSLGNGAAELSYPLVIKGVQEALDYVPAMPSLGRKLARRCWPGPVTIAFDVSQGEGLLEALPPVTHAAVAPQGQVQLRVPAHEALLDVLRLIPAPLVMLSETLPDEPARITATDVLDRFSNDIGLILDDGACRYGQPSTVIRVADDQWNMVQPGVVTEIMMGRLASEIYVFVCTGNTCRSPMAECLFRKLLSEKLQCTEDDLSDRGFVVTSAGVAAATGAPASLEAVEVSGRRGIDLRSHSSQPLNVRLLDQADRIFTMTRGHLDSILAMCPEASGRVNLLSRGNEDISDPIGGGIREYERCEQEIEQNIRSILETIDVK